MRTAAIVRYLYPDADLSSDVLIVDGAIARWDESLGAQPTPQHLADAELPAMRAVASTAARQEAARRIALIQPPELESRSLRWAAQIADLRNTTHPYPAALPAPWGAREAQLRDAGAAIEAIAAASNAMDAELATLATVADCDAYIAGIQADAASTPRTVEWP